ncbi:threonine--tRNA ligase [Bdellovibrio bacteriovorus]|uniref:threonine--tRNA ligase n=1 Tax=Bdellovibrio bacteriovorus TaxID=959 RepID=UPI0035A5802A
MSSVKNGQAGVSHVQKDHRELNHELNYFQVDEAIGAGLPLWLPAGVVIRDELEKLMRELEFLAGYERVVSPHIAKEDLYFQSGHLPYYEESMYPAIDLESVRYRLRPMCCPHHHRIFSSKLRSYRDLPLRLAEYGQVYRYEGSGALSGLMRVRGLCQNDAHLYVRESQVKAEILKVLQMYQKAYQILGIKKYRLRLSKWDRSGDKYVSMPEKWEWAENILREVLIESGLPFEEEAGEAAFYGPKIDIQIESVQGKEESASTVQLDFISAERFDLSFINEAGEKERPVILHRAPLGSHERMVALLVELYQGALPLWLSPEQVVIVPLADRHVAAAEEVRSMLHNAFLRVRVDERVESLQRKLAEAWQSKACYVVVIGDREVDEGMISVQRRGDPSRQKMAGGDLRELLQKEVSSRW